MTLKINYLDHKKGSSKNTALFLAKDAKISEFKGIFEDSTNQKLIKLIKKNNNTQKDKILSLNLDIDQKLIIILIVKKSESQNTEKLGANFYDYIKKNEIDNIEILGSNFPSIKNKIQLNEFLHGSELKSYEFNLYKTKKKDKIINFNILKNKNLINKKKNLN